MRHWFLLAIGALGCSSTVRNSVSDAQDSDATASSTSSGGAIVGTSGEAGANETSAASSQDATISTGSGGSGGADVAVSATTVNTTGAPVDTTSGTGFGGAPTSDTMTTGESVPGGAGGDATMSTTGGSTSLGGGGVSATASTTSAGGTGGAVMTTTGSGGTGGEPEPVECTGLTVFKDCSNYKWRAVSDGDSSAEACVIQAESHCPGAISLFVPANHCLRLHFQGTTLDDNCDPVTGSYAHGSSVDLQRHFLIDEEWAMSYQWKAYMWSDPTGLCSSLNAPAHSSIANCANPTYGYCGFYENWGPRDC